MNTRILVVEDEKITALSISKQLKRLGYEVPAMLSSGEEAASRIEELKPDLVLMDIVLKGTMDGIEAAQALREKVNVPVVYLTAYSDAETLERAKMTDPFGFILKPYEERELQVAIEVALYKHQMQKRLQESERRFATTLSSINDGVISADLNRGVTYLNPKAEVLTGWRLSEASGRNLEEVFKVTDKTGGANSLVCSHQGLAMEEGAHYGALITSTSETLPIDYSVSPMRDGHKEITGLVVVFRDISERLKAEEALYNTEERLRHAQKMEAVGRLAGGVAHDFNNLLVGMVGYAEMILADLDPLDPLCSDIQEIKRAGERAAGLTRQLLAFSRRQVLQPRVFSLDELVRNMEKMLRRLVGEDVELATALRSNSGTVKADPGQLEQVVMNLVVNARDAMPRGGQITIETACLELDDAYARTHVGVCPGPYVVLAISDRNGC
jgi:two-component system cell cycle sensor histidine kinase/response regulator CckA